MDIFSIFIICFTCLIVCAMIGELISKYWTHKERMAGVYSTKDDSKSTSDECNPMYWKTEYYPPNDTSSNKDIVE